MKPYFPSFPTFYCDCLEDDNLYWDDHVWHWQTWFTQGEFLTQDGCPVFLGMELDGYYLDN